ncbi:hypothetical protein BV20DRAFT_547134 [Pilatotrama ljubarskyi]|nr:hypothetical protein BV20DRAFT_547134 [Pilatotrama ljubarskyi]
MRTVNSSAHRTLKHLRRQVRPNHSPCESSLQRVRFWTPVCRTPQHSNNGVLSSHPPSCSSTAFSDCSHSQAGDAVRPREGRSGPGPPCVQYGAADNCVVGRSGRMREGRAERGPDERVGFRTAARPPSQASPGPSYRVAMGLRGALRMRKICAHASARDVAVARYADVCVLGTCAASGTRCQSTPGNVSVTVLATGTAHVRGKIGDIIYTVAHSPFCAVFWGKPTCH